MGLADGGKDKEQSRNKRDEYSSPFEFKDRVVIRSCLVWSEYKPRFIKDNRQVRAQGKRSRSGTLSGCDRVAVNVIYN